MLFCSFCVVLVVSLLLPSFCSFHVHDPLTSNIVRVDPTLIEVSFFFSPPLGSSSVTSRTHMRTYAHCHHQARSRDIYLTTDRRIKRLCSRNWTSSVVSCRRYRHWCDVIRSCQLPQVVSNVLPLTKKVLRREHHHFKNIRLQLSYI